MTAEDLKIKTLPTVLSERPRGPFAFSAPAPPLARGVLQQILSLCAVLVCLMAAGCHHSAAATTTISVTIASPAAPPTIEQGQSVSVSATVANDSTNDGVRWNLAGIGALSNVTTTSVTYSAPISVSASTTITVTAISIADPSMSAVFSIHVTPPIAILVTPQTALVPASGGQQGFAASLNYDENSAGVTWALSGTGCTGAACGALINVTTNSVSYQAPAVQPTPNTVTLTATSVADQTQFKTTTITVTPASPIAVSIVGKIASINAGGNSIQFTATAQNDPTNNGVTWALVVGGVSCQPTCGTLSNVTSSSVTYVPPLPPPPAVPDNMPTLTATSVHDPTKSDTDTFTIQPSTSSNPCLGTPTGNESLLNKQYALWLQGWQGTGTGNPVAIGASFGTDGAGHVTGGEVDINGETVNGVNTPQHLTINSTGGTYTVGLDPMSAGNLACVNLVTSAGSMTFRMALGGVNAGVASKARVIEFDDGSGSGTIAAGILRLQDATSFFTSSLMPNYAFGLDGADSKGDPVSIAGSFGVSSGSIVNGSADINDTGTASGSTASASGPLSGGIGSISGISATTGRGTATFSIGTGHSYQWAIYMVNANEFFIIETDTLGSSSSTPVTTLTSGRAVVTASSLSMASLAGNYIFHQSGIATCNNSPCARVNLGLVNFSNGALNGLLNQYDVSDLNVGNQQNPIVQQSITLGTYTVAASGRVSLSVPQTTLSLPVLYLASPPTDGISAFIAGQDSTAMSGLAEFQPNQTYSTSSLAGNYLLGTEDPRSNAATNNVGTLSIDQAGNVLGTKDRSGQVGLIGGETVAGTLAITNFSGQNGTGFIFSPNFLVITNGTRIFYIDDSGTAQITVIELQ